MIGRARIRASGKRYARLSTVNLASLLAVLVLPTTLMSPFWSHFPVGLPVRTFQPRPRVAPVSSGIQPVLVHLATDGAHVSVLVNGRPVAIQDLGAAFQSELRLRPPHWPVYVEGDPALTWVDVARVIDAIQGAGGEVMLLKYQER